MTLATKIAAAVVVGASLAACSDSGGSVASYNPDPTVAYPISAKQKEAVLVLDNLSERGLAHDPSLSARMGAFTYDFVNRSSSTMQVLIGAGTADDAAAKEIARETVRVLAKHGVPASRLDVKVISGNRSVKPGAVVMRYTQWTAVAPECPGYGANMSIDYSNSNTPNFGCTMQRNIAAMVADPRDFEQPSAMGMREGAPAEAGVRKYRSGAETKTFTWTEVE